MLGKARLVVVVVTVVLEIELRGGGGKEGREGGRSRSINSSV